MESQPAAPITGLDRRRKGAASVTISRSVAEVSIWPCIPTTQPALWPELPLAAWQDTYATLHMWTQIVGKVRLALTPRINHWWEVALYVNARGLTTSAIPYGDGIFEIQFDFIDHELIIKTSWGSVKTLALRPQSVADFYAEFMSALRSLGIEVKIWSMPVRGTEPGALRERHAACILRSRICAPILAGIDLVR